jgi:hypothetical protein
MRHIDIFRLALWAQRVPTLPTSLNQLHEAAVDLFTSRAEWPAGRLAFSICAVLKSVSLDCLSAKLECFMKALNLSILLVDLTLCVDKRLLGVCQSCGDFSDLEFV